MSHVKCFYSAGFNLKCLTNVRVTFTHQNSGQILCEHVSGKAS
jgi:hypothetical protein